MKIYLLIPNELLLSSGHIGLKNPECKAKITIGFDVQKLMHKTTTYYPPEIQETKGFVTCEFGMSNDHLSVTSPIDSISMKTAKQSNTIVSRQHLTLCDHI